MSREINPITNDTEERTNHTTGIDINSKFPKLLQDKSYTRIFGRYSFSDFAYNILPTSRITNVITGKETTLNYLHKTRETVELQALDFSGIIILREKKNELEIRLGNNELVYREFDDSLIAHQVHFIHYINHSK